MTRLTSGSSPTPLLTAFISRSTGGITLGLTILNYRKRKTTSRQVIQILTIMSGRGNVVNGWKGPSMPENSAKPMKKRESPRLLMTRQSRSIQPGIWDTLTIPPSGGIRSSQEKSTFWSPTHPAGEVFLSTPHKSPDGLPRLILWAKTL